MLQELLQRLKEDVVRNDFVNASNGACTIEKAEMEFIDKFAKHVVPVRPKFSNEQSFPSSAKTCADHLNFVVDGRPRQFLDTGITYEKAKELFSRIQSCAYWEKDVEVVEDSRAETDTPNTEDLESKYEKSEDAGEETLPVSAPAPAQVPTPTFNGNVNAAMPVQQPPQQPMHQRPLARNPQQSQQAALPAAPTNGPVNMKNHSVTAVENAYFNQMQYSQQQAQLMSNAPITPSQSDYGTNFSFLQDSELEPSPGSQQKMPVNVIQTVNQPKPSPVQIQQMQQAHNASQNFKNASFHPQSPIAGQMYPPGLKVQHALQTTVSHIPVNYQPSPQQLNQQTAVPSSQVPNMIPKQQRQSPVNGNQAPGYGASQTPPIQQQQQAQQQTSRPAYPTNVPKAQYQQNPQNVKTTEQKQTVSRKHDGSGDTLKSSDGAGRNVQGQEKEKKRDDQYQQQPEIDTWTNETATQSAGNNNYSSRSSGGYNRTNRTSGGGAGAKFNNYR